MTTRPVSDPLPRDLLAALTLAAATEEDPAPRFRITAITFDDRRRVLRGAYGPEPA